MFDSELGPDEDILTEKIQIQVRRKYCAVCILITLFNVPLWSEQTLSSSGTVNCYGSKLLKIPYHVRGARFFLRTRPCPGLEVVAGRIGIVRCRQDCSATALHEYHWIEGNLQRYDDDHLASNDIRIPAVRWCCCSSQRKALVVQLRVRRNEAKSAMDEAWEDKGAAARGEDPSPAPPSEASFTEVQRQFLSRLANNYRKGINCDMKVQVSGGQVFPFYKVVLTTFSDVFRVSLGTICVWLGRKNSV